VFKRDHVDESGKMDVSYVIWDRDDPKFGISDSGHTKAVGMSIRDNRSLIKNFLGHLIERGESKVCYKYIGASEELPDGFITEIIPVTCESKKFDSEVIDQLKQMRKMVDEL